MNPIAILMSSALLAAPLSAAPAAETLRNLATARQGETAACARYEKFAQVADAEGHPQAARLFRAAAKAESIHAAKQERAIRRFGGEPAALETPPVRAGTTEENLRAAIAGETAESKTMYPGFEETAKTEKARKAMSAFRYARKTEAAHVELFTAALESIGRDDGTTYAVCPVCGLTLAGKPSKSCRICDASARKFITF